MGNCRGLPLDVRHACNSNLLSEVKLLCSAKYAMFTHTPGDVSLYLPKWITRINLWHGNPIKYILDDTPEKKSAYKRHKLKWLNQNPKDCDYFFSGGNRFNQIMASCTGLDPDRILSEGLPRNEILYQSVESSADQPAYCIYAPTFRDKLTQEDRIEELCRKWRVVFESSAQQLKIKLHPNDKTDLSFCSHYPWAEVADKNRDINQLLISSCSLITDYSSVAFDFLILQKPVYMLMDDISMYLTVRGGTYIETEELKRVFNCVETIDQLVHNMITGKAEVFDDNAHLYNKRFDFKHFMSETISIL